MDMKIVYTFPLLGPIRTPVHAFFCSEANQLFAFAIKAIIDPAILPDMGFNPLQLFVVDSTTTEVTHVSIPLPVNATTQMLLLYNYEDASWVLADKGRKVIVYEVDGNENQRLNKVYEIDDIDVGHGDKQLIAFYQKNSAFPLIFSVADLSEMDPDRIYFTQWSGLESEEKPIAIDPSGLNKAHMNDDICFLFTVNRVFPHTPDAGSNLTSNQVPGIWCPSIETRDLKGSLIKKHVFNGFSFPIRDRDCANNDFFQYIFYDVEIIDGPIKRQVNTTDTTIVLALKGALQDDKSTVKNSLYWIRHDGNILQHVTCPLGEKIRLCCCGNKVIGTDRLHGIQRLWAWAPSINSDIAVCGEFPFDVKSVTLVSMKIGNKESEELFWCIEEYENGLNVSQWDSINMHKLESKHCEGFSLLKKSYPAFGDHKLSNICSFNSKLFIIGVNSQKKLQLLQFE